MDIKKKRRNKGYVSAALFSMSIGCLCNEWLLSAIFSHDAVLVPSTRLLIWIFDLSCILLGLCIIGFTVYGKRKEVVFSIVTFVVFFGLLELGCRMFVKKEMSPLIADGVLHHRLRPNFEWVEDIRGDYINKTYINIQSWAEKYDILPEKPANTYRIFYVGDSNIQGVVVHEKRLVEIIESELNPSSWLQKNNCVMSGS